MGNEIVKYVKRQTAAEWQLLKMFICFFSFISLIQENDLIVYLHSFVGSLLVLSGAVYVL